MFYPVHRTSCISSDFKLPWYIFAVVYLKFMWQDIIEVDIKQDGRV